MSEPNERGVTLTRRGWSLTGAALGLAVGSFLLGALEMLVVGVAALALLGAVVLWLRFGARPELAISRRVHPDRLHVGSEGRIDLLVENLGTRATPLLSATDWFDEGRRAARFLVPPLAAGATARAAYRIPTRRRGRYRVGPLSVARQRSVRTRPPRRRPGPARPNWWCDPACTTSWRRSRSGAGSPPRARRRRPVRW